MAITKSINEYQITTAGKMKTLNIPTEHRLVVTQGVIVGNGADDGYELQVQIYTFKDSNHTILLSNDLIPEKKLTFDLGATLPTKSIQSVTATELEGWLDTKIGVGKWAKIK